MGTAITMQNTIETNTIYPIINTQSNFTVYKIMPVSFRYMTIQGMAMVDISLLDVKERCIKLDQMGMKILIILDHIIYYGLIFAHSKKVGFVSPHTFNSSFITPSCELVLSTNVQEVFQKNLQQLFFLTVEYYY